MPFQASSLAMVQSTEICRASPTWDQRRLMRTGAGAGCARARPGSSGSASSAGRMRKPSSAATCIGWGRRATPVSHKYAGERMDTWYERLSTLDSFFLEIEDRTGHMHGGAVAIFEGPPPPYRDLLPPPPPP